MRIVSGVRPVLLVVLIAVVGPQLIRGSSCPRTNDLLVDVVVVLGNCDQQNSIFLLFFTYSNTSSGKFFVVFHLFFLHKGNQGTNSFYRFKSRHLYYLHMFWHWGFVHLVTLPKYGGTGLDFRCHSVVIYTNDLYHICVVPTSRINFAAVFF